jgi:hypothetical protein
MQQRHWELETQLIEEVILFISRHFAHTSLTASLTALHAYFAQAPSRPSLWEPAKDYISQLIEKKPRDLGEYSYLQSQELPPIWEHGLPPYDPVTSPYFDMRVLRWEERTEEEELKAREQRFAAEVFCRRGYGINVFREAISDGSYVLNKERFKSLMGTTIRLGFRSIEMFLLNKMKRNTSALRRVEAKAMLTPLLNASKGFSPKNEETFYRCLRTCFQIKTEPALDQDVVAFYKEVVWKTRGPAYVRVIDERLSPKEEDRVNRQNYEVTRLWSP